MKTALLLPLLSGLCVGLGLREECSDQFVTVDFEGEGYWQGRLQLQVTSDISGWEVGLGFSAQVDTVYCSLASVSGSGTEWSLSSFSWDDELHSGTTLEVGIVVHYSGSKPSVIDLSMNDQTVCSGGAETTTTITTTASTSASNPTSTSNPSGDCDDVYIVDADEVGYWQGRLVVTVPTAVSDWELRLTFSDNVDSLDCSLASVSGSGSQWTLTSYAWDGDLEAGTTLEVGIIVHYSGATPSVTGLSINDMDLCSASGSTSAPSEDCSEEYAVDSEEEGMWQGRIFITPSETLSDWSLSLQFSADVDSLDCALASVSGSGQDWSLTSYEWDGELEAGVTLEVGIIVYYTGAKPSISGLSLNDLSLCSGDSVPTTSPPTPTAGSDDCDGDDYLVDMEETGSWQGRILVRVPETVSGWEVKLHFTDSLDSLECALAQVSGAGDVWSLTSYDWDGDLEAGLTLEIGVLVQYSGNKPLLDNIIFNEMVQCSGGDSTPTETTPGSTTSSSGDDCNDEYVIDTDGLGVWQGRIFLSVPEAVSGWEIKIHFNTDLTDLECALGSVSGAGELWTVTSYEWDDDLEAGTTLEIGIIVHFSQSRPFINNIIFNETPYCSGGFAPTTEHPTPTTKTSTTPTTHTTESTSTSTTTKPTTSHDFTVRIVTTL